MFDSLRCEIMAEAIVLRRFAKSEGGNFAIIFGLLLVPMMGLIGTAVDYSSMLNRQSKIQAAADTALLAAARDAPTSTEFYRLAENYLAANLDGIEVEMVAKANPKNVSLTLTNEFETSFLAIIGQPQIKIEVYSEVAVDKFGRGSADIPKYQAKELNKQLDQLEAQLLKQLYKIPPRDQEKARKQIKRQIAYLKRKASSELPSGEIHLSK